MILAAFVPALAFILLFAVARPRCPDGRTALLVAAVVWGVLVVATTEVLSLFHAIRVWILLGVWLALSAVLGEMARRRRRPPGGEPHVRIGPGAGVLAALVVTALLAALVGLVAVVAPPNTYDSMTYHMARVAHWAQNGSVEHYPTSIIRQLAQPPWAEFAILQAYVLTGGDRLANAVQWFSMLGSLVGVSLVARQLGGDRRAQVLAAMVALTIPMGVVQASGTKNDYVAAFWLICLAAFVLALNGRPAGAVGPWGALTGGALGLAVLTKATAYLFATPFVVWACIVRIRRDRGQAWRPLVGLFFAAAVINAPYFARNIERYGSPLGPARDGVVEYVNASPGLRATVSVALRNIGLHLGTPWGAVNDLTGGVIRGIHRTLGLEVDDPSTTWWRASFTVSGPKRQEDMVSGGLHLALVGVAVVALALRANLRTPERLTYVAALVVGFALFCAILRWQPWHSRLHLPLFVLWAPLIGLVLGRRAHLAALVVVVLVAIAVTMVLANEPRPLLGVLRESREALYFRAQPGLRAPYTDAVALLAERGCSRLGLRLGGDDWEYPFWVLARAAIIGARLEHLEPAQPPDRSRDMTRSRPCGIVTTREERAEIPGYRRVLSRPGLTVFLPDPAGAKP